MIGSPAVLCEACLAELPLVWDVQSRKYVHLRGLATFQCEALADRERRARDIANDRGNEDQRGR